MPSGPLSGRLVLDFSTLLPGPFAGLILAEAGAEVIKIERPGGEDMRHFPPAFGETSAPHALLNRGKRLLEIDLKDADAREILKPLLARADVVIEQFRPGVMDRLGLGHQAVAALNPGVVYCSITGYGQTGPKADAPGHDLNYMAEAGLLSASHGALDAPVVPPVLVADIGGGTLPAVINILLALMERDRTGRGRHLDIAMTEMVRAFGVLVEAGTVLARSGDGMLTGGLPRYGLYATADGRLLAVGALEERFWRIFCDLVGLPERLRADAATPDETRAALRAILRARTADAWLALFAGTQACVSLVATPEEAARDSRHRVANASGETLPAASVPLVEAFRQAPDIVPAPGAARPVTRS
jgi:crotonobetainyl-CoA:carnitine CoA-transferase CaiB-like acyl-CoA transferase